MFGFVQEESLDFTAEKFKIINAFKSLGETKDVSYAKGKLKWLFNEKRKLQIEMHFEKFFSLFRKSFNELRKFLYLKKILSI